MPARPSGRTTSPKKKAVRVKPKSPAASDDLRSLVSTCERLQEALAEVPKATDFQPLADHFYAFAQRAPALLTALEQLLAAPRRTAVVRLSDAAAELEEAHRTLLAAIGTLPREEDYAPTARQLRELASVSPSLLEWLQEVPKLRAPLADSLGALREADERIAAARAAVLSALQELQGDD